MDKQTDARRSDRAPQGPFIIVELTNAPITTWAVAVIEYPGGMAWVEPHYIDSWATRQASHVFEGALHWQDHRAVLDGEQPCIVREAAGDEIERAMKADRAWRQWVKEQGRSVAQERARLLTEILPDLEPDDE